jgi:ABC-type dipeptide/oligopeptide/nickel transport system ATPase component
VADEPTSCLDTITQAQILSLLRNIQKKYKFAMILITHDLSIVATLAENICVMYKGKIVEYGKVQTILKNPAHPYTISLLKSIPSLIYEYGNK